MSNQFRFEKCTPESVGIPSEAVQEFLGIIKKEHFELHGIIISRHEKIIAEGYFKPYTEKTLHRLFSAAKSVNMTAVLCMVQEGLINLDDRMCDLLPEMMPEEISDRLSRLTLYHMLCMATGHGAAGFFFLPPHDKNPVKKFFEMPLEYEPGKKFIYNNGVPGVLEYLIQKISGETVVDYLEPRVFQPLGIDRTFTFANGGPIALPNLSLETRDMFKLAMLFARHGNWEGKQIIREDLADLAGQQHVPNGDFDVYPAPPENLSGYGWQMWRNPPGGYRFDGAMGQYAVVLPDFDMVIAMNMNERGSYDVLALLWKVLLRKIYLRPLPENPEAYEKLCLTLADLDLGPESECDGIAEGRYLLSEELAGIREIKFEQEEDAVKMTVNGSDKVVLKPGSGWFPAKVPITVPDCTVMPGYDMPNDGGELDPSISLIMSAWTKEDTLTIHFRSSAWLGGYILKVRFLNDHIELSYWDSSCENWYLRSEDLKDWNASAGWYHEAKTVLASRVDR